MGLLAWLRGDDLASASREPDALAEVYQLPTQQGDVAQVSDLPPEVAQAFGINLDFERVTREQAMSVPAVRRGRQIICGTLGTAPLIMIRTRAGNPPERVARTLLTQPDPKCPLSRTLTLTLDGLLFHGLAWWRVLEFGADRFPLRAEWIHHERVMVDTTSGVVRVDGRVVKDRELIRFDAPDEGILKHGARAIKTALMLEEAVRRYARMDIPLGYLKDTEGALEEAESKQVLDAWEAARRQRTTGYIPKGFNYEAPGFNAQQLQLGEARDHQAADIARLMNLPPSAVNAPSGDSLTYATTESNRRELVDLTFAPYVAAIEQRLSMGDVTPAGSVVRMDLGAFQRGDTAAVIAAGAQAVTSGLMTKDEVRVEWLKLPPLPADAEPATEPAEPAEESA